jgi:phosphotransferase system enzyme I (PtsI)
LVIKAAFLAGIPLFESGAIRHGVMFETPVACRQARELIAEADFASIGTNDLTEHLFNVDRNSDQAHQAASRPALWEMIEIVVKAGQEKGKPVFVCGELAKRSEFFKRFIELGVNGISVPIKMIPEIRNQIAIKV